MLNLLGTTHNVAVLIGDQQITGEDMYLTEYNLSISPQDMMFKNINGDILKYPMPQIAQFDLSFRGSIIHQSILDGFKQGQIRNKRVCDCTIEELLFAVKNKL